MKRWILIVIVLSFLMPLIVKAESVSTGKFMYMPAFQEAKEETYYYSDNYFRESGKKDNEHLLAMSFNLAISTFEIRNYTYSKALLEEIGFQDIKALDMIDVPSLNTIGTVMGHKKIDGYNLVAVTIRGEKYDSEWGNNFIVGKENDAKGFSDTSVKVLDRVQKYISENHLENVKLWIVGYSRAGAVADLMGVYINQHLDEFGLTDNDLYVYTYETPAASLDSTVYDNIYVVKNKNDLIPLVYPSNWNYHTNGKVIMIGEEGKITSYTGLMQQIASDEVDEGTFINDFINWLSSRLSRDMYASYVEEPVSKILDIYFKKSEEDRATLMDFIMNDVKPVVSEYVDITILDIFERNTDSIYISLTDKVIEAINSVRDTEKVKVLTEEEYQIIIESIYPLFRALGPVVDDDYYYFDGIDYDSYYLKYHPQFALDPNEYAYYNGKQMGASRGYDDAFYEDSEDNTVPDWFFEETDTKEYIENFSRGYQEVYHDNYLIGLSHINNPYEKGRYEGLKSGRDIGYRAGADGEEYAPDPDYYYLDPYWIGEETECDYDLDEYCETEKIYSPKDLEDLETYKNAYFEGFNEGYQEEYSKGVADGPDRGMEKSMYHFATLLKNISTILTYHYPQTTLSYIHALDSYYLPNELTDGDGQVIDIDLEEVEDLTVTTSGPLEKLVNVQVDHQDIDMNYVELVSGSTIATLKSSYLKTLSEGVHTLSLIYIDNTIDAEFTIQGQPIVDAGENPVEEDIDNPGTGDTIDFYYLLFFISIIGMIGNAVYLKKQTRGI